MKKAKIVNKVFNLVKNNKWSPRFAWGKINDFVCPLHDKGFAVAIDRHGNLSIQHWEYPCYRYIHHVCDGFSQQFKTLERKFMKDTILK